MRITRIFLYCRNIFSSNRNNTSNRTKRSTDEDFNLSEKGKSELTKNRVDENKDENIHTDVIESLLPQASDSVSILIQADCRSFEEKKNEINDTDLNNYLETNASKTRRNAICEKIDKLENNKQLLNFMEYLLREDYIKNFLL